MDTINIINYATMPQVGVKNGVVLAVAVLAAAPSQAPEPVHKALSEVQSSLAHLEAGIAIRKELEARNTRVADQELGRAWGALQEVISSTLALPPGPRRESGELVYAALFVDGLSFLKDSYSKQWAESRRRLQVCEEQGLEAAIATAAGGPEHFAHLREAHAASGEVLNITEMLNVAEPVNLFDRLNALKAAISRYAVQIVAWSLSDIADPQAVRNALYPIDRLRESEARRANGEEPIEPDEEAGPDDTSGFFERPAALEDASIDGEQDAPGLPPKSGVA